LKSQSCIEIHHYPSPTMQIWTGSVACTASLANFEWRLPEDATVQLQI